MPNGHKGFPHHWRAGRPISSRRSAKSSSLQQNTYRKVIDTTGEKASNPPWQLCERRRGAAFSLLEFLLSRYTHAANTAHHALESALQFYLFKTRLRHSVPAARMANVHREGFTRLSGGEDDQFSLKLDHVFLRFLAF